MSLVLHIDDEQADRIAFRSPQAGLDEPPQPRPYDTEVLTTPDGAWTTIIRRWHHGDHEDCGLCPDGGCNARYGACSFMVPGRVSIGEARFYSTRGMTRVASGTGHPAPGPIRIVPRSPGDPPLRADDRAASG
jgi:hypothetical protein